MKAISRTSSPNGSGCFVRLFGLVFFLVGAGLFFFLSGRPIFNWMVAQSWQTVPCTILSSSVGTHSSSDGGDTYSLDIRYAYEWEGQHYESERYNFFGGSSSGYDRKVAVVERYPEGETRACYVNPETPSDAVLTRDFSPVYLIGGFGLIFLTIGAFLLFHRGKKSGALSEAATARTITSTVSQDDAYMKLMRRLSGVDPSMVTTTSVTSGEGFTRIVQLSSPEAVIDGPLVLKGGRNGLVGFVFMSIFALIWNGITFVALWDSLPSGDGSSIDLVQLLFLAPFLLIGLGVAGGAVYFFLTLFNPRVDLTMNPGRLVLGGSAVVGWSFRGDSGRVRKLFISLEGRESATYRRGTSTTTDRSVFEKIPLFETEDAAQIRQGEITVAVPEFTAPSFQGSSNKIEWQLKVRGDIARWPDVNEEFDVFVTPLPHDPSVTPQPAEFRLSGEAS